MISRGEHEGAVARRSTGARHRRRHATFRRIEARLDVHGPLKLACRHAACSIRCDDMERVVTRHVEQVRHGHPIKAIGLEGAIGIGAATLKWSGDFVVGNRRSVRARFDGLERRELEALLPWNVTALLKAERYR